jgi:hypothetical protein
VAKKPSIEYKKKSSDLKDVIKKFVVEARKLSMEYKNQDILYFS